MIPVREQVLREPEHLHPIIVALVVFLKAGHSLKDADSGLKGEVREKLVNCLNHLPRSGFPRPITSL